jgi:16S rRNA (adenine1518-N6/adenine1519-N6)-dimethyltransferase
MVRQAYRTRVRKAFRPTTDCNLFAAFRVATLPAYMARQRLGQHFLGDIGWRKRILKTLPLGPNETWVEIGPGHGEMTQLLAGDGRRIVAIEADGNLAAGIKTGIESEPQNWPGVEIVYSDVLNADIGKLGGDRFRVYGNLPYYITSPILHHLFQWAGQIASIHIVIQLEVAQRIAAHPGIRDYGYLSTLCQFYGRPKIALRIPPGAFRPPPKVESALVGLTLPGDGAALGLTDPKKFLNFIQMCFEQKRKTLRNNLLEISDDAHIHQALANSGLRPDARAEQLSLPQFAAIFQQLT